MGTANGLARFDGVRFVVFNLANTPGLLSDDIYGLYEDRHGNLWMRTRRGLARRQYNGRFESLSLTNGGPPAVFWNFAEDTAGNLWMRGPDGFARWTGDKIERVPLPADGPKNPVHLCPAPDGGLWLADRRGLWRYRDGPVEFFPTSPAPELIAAGRDGRVWGLSAQQGLFVLTNRVWSQVADFGNETCATLCLTPNGDVWAGSERRTHAFRVRAGRVTEIGLEQGLEGNRALAFLQDVDGNVWLGANAGGLFRLRERRVRVYDRADGLESLNTSSLVRTDDGALMVNVMGRTLHRFTDGRLQALRVESPVSAYDNPTALAPAREGGVWAGTFYGPLRRVVASREVERVGSEGGTRSLFTDREGRLWRGTRTAGIERFDGTNLTRFTTNEGLSFNNVYCFAQDRDGAVWAGTEQGLNRIERNRVTRFGATDGLGHPFVSALCVDSRGTLWAGTLGGGLSAWSGTRFVTLTTREGLPHDTVEQLLEDDFGHLWLGTRLGLLRVAVDQLHDCIEGKARVVTGTLIGRDEGLLRPNFWTEYQPASLKTRDGRLWFCTGSGLVEIDPRHFATPAAPPVVHLEEVAVDGVVRSEIQNPNPEITLPPGSERLEIRYTGISPSEPAQVRFRYRLLDYDRDWVEAGRARFASYSKLPPGRYTFQVKAANNDGVWNETGAALALIVQPAFWQTWWFRGALAALSVGAIFAAYRGRIARLERRRVEQEAFSRKLIESQEQERKRIAAELHDSLGQNLLVIKNRAALALTQQDQPDKMAAQVGEVSLMASAAIREVREIAQNLRPFQFDELGLTKAIAAMVRKLAGASVIEFQADLDDLDGALPPEFEINIYRIVQECLNNVVKHSQAKRATIRLRREARGIRLTFIDDGRGFTPDLAEKALPSGFGLRTITERARTVGGEATFDSRPGQGTRVDIVIPFKVA
jgi:signal transduction histidine kinase/ligand-binding sensor domain-containing protein